MNSARLIEAKSALDAKVVHMAAHADGVILVQGSTIVPEPVLWLWLNWLARGKFHVLAGAPGQGKTMLALAIAAIVSSGGRWPDGSRSREAANVLIWSGEDDPADTLVPRLLAMGADMTRVYFVTGTRIAGEIQPFDPSRDLIELTLQAERIGSVALLVVDPVVSAVSGDSHKNTEVRRSLQPLVDLGARLDASVLGISHFSKGSAGREPTERVVGSMAFGAVARVVLCAAKVKGADGAEDRRILVRSKSNIGPDDGGFEYGIVQEELEGHPGISASSIQWGKAIEGTARELLAEAEEEPGLDGEAATALDDACAFLTSELTHGPKSAKHLFTEARHAGHSERTIKRAKSRLGIESRKESSGWVWGHPTTLHIQVKGAKEAKDSTSENLGTLGTLESDWEAV